MDLSQMTTEQLVAENQRLGEQIDAIRAQRRAINAELARRQEADVERQVREEVERRLGRRPGDATASGATLVASAPKPA